MRAQNGRLLIAVDQFEECLILQDQASKDRLAELFSKLQKKPIEGLQLLLVLRTDYLKFDELTGLHLPDPRPRENWFNLEVLSHADARSILRRSLPASLEAHMNLNNVRISGNGKNLGLPELGDIDRSEVVAFDADDIEASVEALKGLPATIVIETWHEIDAFSRQLNEARSSLGLEPAKVVRWRW